MSNNQSAENGDNNQNLQRQIVPSGSNNRAEPREENSPMHPCAICLETAAYAVISFCGHLYCWPCIYLWMQSRPPPSQCPICQSLIGSNTLIPVNGRYDDRHLVSARMQGIPERRPCPSIGSQRRHAIHCHQEILRWMKTPTHFDVLTANYYSTTMPGLDRIAPLHPALLPRQVERFEVVESYGNPYINRIILFVMLYLITKFISNMPIGELQGSK